ncbi:lytic transglycosylase domain-containing protein [Paraburkholderia sp. BL21I4N1]|uniref:lytic transglycosylase domain-containing protein n=1 Tax=Paraburkholderia sp. BL21I4N1 TaxID=1938801 RepID=UPI000CFAD8EF|nr:lytic transglycosylase domain-containing protein [Paraburkholderia sp. BL21I4N1]PQV53825.1 soluble lytic murein transglycosylase-like protein [Paraburkholderia sp. BL21I4N1]
MHGNSVLDGVQRQRQAGSICPASRLTTMLAAIALSFGVAAQAADAQSAAVTPVAVASNSISASMSNSTSDSIPESALPSLSDITAMLRAQFRVAPMESMTIARAVLTESDRHAISPVLLLAVMSVESSFDRHAVSVAGARGLMQVLPSAHPQLIAGTTDLSDPAINVRIGTTILRDYLDASGGDLAAALLRYSGGGRGYARRVVLRMQSFDASLRRE